MPSQAEGMLQGKQGQEGHVLTELLPLNRLDILTGGDTEKPYNDSDVMLHIHDRFTPAIFE